MFRRKTVQEALENYARKSLMAFLKGKKTLNWIIGIIRSSGVRGRELEEIFKQLQGYGSQERLQQAHEQCHKEGWLCELPPV
jgi:hypothetical protein